MSSVEDLIDFVNDPSVSVVVRKPPQFVSCFLDNQDEIIFISKAPSKKLPLTVPKDALSTSLLSLDDLSITGQPLPAPFSPSDSLNMTESNMEGGLILPKEECAPVMIDKAREYLSHCNLSLKLNLPVWILTKGEDASSPVLLSTQKGDGWIERSWVIDKGHQDIPPLNTLLKAHLALANLPQKFVEYSITATYMIKSNLVGELMDEFYSSTKLVLSWNKLCIEPPIESSTRTKLTTMCKIGCSPCNSLQNIWRQLLLLNNYIQLIHETKSVNITNFSLPSSDSVLEGFGIEKKSESIVSRVGPTLREPKKGFSSLPLKKPTLKAIFNQFPAPHNPAMDLTDRLWLLFIECSTYQELASCFKQLFIEVQKASSVPFISPSNISSLAKSLNGGGGANILNPLEFLVEIGIEKLRKEVLMIFSKAQMATASMLCIPRVSKFTEVGCDQWEGVVRTWLTWLAQLQCSLELLLEMQEDDINLPNDLLLTASTKILNEFVGPSSKIDSLDYLIENSLQEISISLPTVAMQQVIPASFETWILRLTSTSSFKKVVSVVHCATNSPLPFRIESEDSFCGNVTALSMVESTYSMAQMNSIRDKTGFLTEASSKLPR